MFQDTAEPSSCDFADPKIASSVTKTVQMLSSRTETKLINAFTRLLKPVVDSLVALCRISLYPEKLSHSDLTTALPTEHSGVTLTNQ